MMQHVSVLAQEVLDYSNISKELNASFTALDVTFGLGGHSKLLLSTFPSLKLVAIDKDESTRVYAAQAFSGMENRFRSYGLCFSDLKNLPNLIEPDFLGESELKFDLIIADLGISSAQLDDESRGLSFKAEADLDMRLDRTQKLTASDVLNTYSERDLFLVFARGGVGSASKSLARAIVEDRPLSNTKEFHSICNSVLRTKTRNQTGKKQTDLATVPFQAVRIEVNNEFGVLKDFLGEAVGLLKENGRLLVISFHSLEDKIAAGFMRWWSSIRGKGLHSEDVPLGKILTRKAIKPTEDEVKTNSRARSALLRVFERNSNQIWEERSLKPEHL